MESLIRPRLLLLLTLFTAVAMHAATHASSAHSGAPGAFDDEAAVRAVITEYEAAWNRHDMTAFADLFADDAQWINIVGMWWRSKSDLVRAHAVYHETMFRDTPLQFEEVAVRTIAPGVAIAVATVEVGSFSTPGGQTIPRSGNRMSFVLAQRNGGWQIVSGHNTVIDPAAAAHDPVNRP